jgi:hypothetical protein
MSWPNRPSSGVQVVEIKESAARCNAVLLFVQQPVYLMMADKAETCSDNEEKIKREY